MSTKPEAPVPSRDSYANRDLIASFVKVSLPEVTQFTEVTESLRCKCLAVSSMDASFPFADVSIQLSILKDVDYDPVKCAFAQVVRLVNNVLEELDGFCVAMKRLKTLTMELLKLPSERLDYEDSRPVIKCDELSSDGTDSNGNVHDEMSDVEDDHNTPLLPPSTKSIVTNTNSSNNISESFSSNPTSALSHIIQSPLIHVYPSYKKCGKVSVNSKRIAAHERICGTEYVYACLHCPKNFTSTDKTIWRRHNDTHRRKRRPHPCTKCSSSFTLLTTLQRHMRTTHPDHPRSSGKSSKRIFKPKLRPSCSECRVKFKTAKDLHQHMLIHPNLCPEECSVCPKRFFIRPQLKEHVALEHNGILLLSCVVCNKVFQTEQALMSHCLLNHSPSIPVNCNECGKIYESAPKLKLHRNVKHGVARPQQCSVCGIVLKTKIILKSHMVIHSSNPKPYTCEMCGKLFARAGGLLIHRRRHTGETPYVCETCGKGYVTDKERQVHVMTMHTFEKPFVCDICGKAFILKVELHRHQRSHRNERPFTCDICGKAFLRENHLQRHGVTHAVEKPFACNICHKGFTTKFNLNIHFRAHTKEKPFECEVCGKRFRSRTETQRHIKRMHETQTLFNGEKKVRQRSKKSVTEGAENCFHFE